MGLCLSIYSYRTLQSVASGNQVRILHLLLLTCYGCIDRRDLLQMISIHTNPLDLRQSSAATFGATSHAARPKNGVNR